MAIEITHHGDTKKFNTWDSFCEWTIERYGSFHAADIITWSETAQPGNEIPEYDITIKTKKFAF